MTGVQTCALPISRSVIDDASFLHGKSTDAYHEFLGSQALPIPCPSHELWTRGFKALTGAATVDKYMREPSLLNPIVELEDFRSVDSDKGPKKRKALDGIVLVSHHPLHGPSPALNPGLVSES